MRQTGTAPDGVGLEVSTYDSSGVAFLVEDGKAISPRPSSPPLPWPTMADARQVAEWRYLARQRVKFPDYLPGDYYFTITWRTE